MLRNAPEFFEVAKRIVEMTNDCVLVAHNAKFDYRILKLEFSRLGVQFERKSLCTVELSKKLIPGLPSYSLGKLVRSLGIPISDRHRASGDALATIKLFEILLSRDVTKEVVKTSIRIKPKLQIEPKLSSLIESMTCDTGIYYMYDCNGEIIYIGKSKNIKKRINQHFIGQTPKSKKIQLEVSTITYDKTGSELLALLKENAEIKQHKPKFNRALRRTIFTHGLFSFTDQSGYKNLKVQKIKLNERPIITFSNIKSGKSFVSRLVEKYELCQKLCGIYNNKSNCFDFIIKKCNGACIEKEPSEVYNMRVEKALKNYSLNSKSMIVIDKGRDLDERSAVWLENGILRGYTYFNLNHQITNLDVLSNLITPLDHNKDAQHIVQSYIRRNKKLKIIYL